MVPMLAWRVLPSERTIYAITTFRMAGAAPQVTVHVKYSPVAPAVSGFVPSRASSGPLAASRARVKIRPPHIEP